MKELQLREAKTTLMEALKEATRIDRLQGKLSDTEYESQKQALEVVLRRALTKKPAV